MKLSAVMSSRLTFIKTISLPWIIQTLLSDREFLYEIVLDSVYGKKQHPPSNKKLKTVAPFCSQAVPLSLFPTWCWEKYANLL